MENIEKKILDYWQLTPPERKAVEEYVESNPEWAPLLSDVRVLEELAAEARLLRAMSPGDEALAYYVVARRFQEGEFSESLHSVFQRIEVRLEKDPDLQARYEALEERLEETMGALNPKEQFEALTGRTLSEETPSRGRADRETVPSARSRAVSSSPPGNNSADASAATARLIRLPRGARWAVAASIAVAAVYGVLFVVSWSTQSTVERLAAVEPSETTLEGYEVRTRGRTSPAAEKLSTDMLYRQALATLGEARTSTLGLFPRYDQQKLNEAEALLTRVVEREDSGSFLQLEAYFFLGKVNLAQGKVEAARSHFKAVVAGEGRRAREATRILETLQEAAPARYGHEPIIDSTKQLPTGE